MDNDAYMREVNGPPLVLSPVYRKSVEVMSVKCPIKAETLTSYVSYDTRKSGIMWER